MRIDQFDLVRPASVDEACAVLAEHGPEARAISGGTDLLVRMKQGIVSPRLVVDVKAIPGLSYIQTDGDGGLRIGAATTLRAVEKSPAVREGFAALSQAAERVASVQLRNMGTLGGNICLETMCWYYNQSRAWKRSKPACTKAGGETCYVANRAGICYATYRGDTATALMALGARVRLQSKSGQRIIPLEEFFTGDGQVPNVLTPGELMTEILLPAQPAGSRSVYLKLSHRAAVDYPLVAVGAVLAVSGGRCADACIVLGAVGSGPIRSKKAEEAIRGGRIGEDLVAKAADLAVKDARAINNLAQGSPLYRRQMVRVLTRRALLAVTPGD